MEIISYEPRLLKELLKLFYDTVHAINRRDYTDEQLMAWAPKKLDEAEFMRKFSSSKTLVAWENDKAIGFVNIYENGYLDCLYVHKDHQGEGVGTKLLKAAVLAAKAPIITTYGSITSLPFFQKRGFIIVRENEVKRGRVTLRNYLLELKTETALIEKTR